MKKLDERSLNNVSLKEQVERILANDPIFDLYDGEGMQKKETNKRIAAFGKNPKINDIKIVDFPATDSYGEITKQNLLVLSNQSKKMVIITINGENFTCDKSVATQISALK